MFKLNTSVLILLFLISVVHSDESFDDDDKDSVDDDNLEIIIDDFMDKFSLLGDHFQSKMREEVIMKNYGKTLYEKEKQAWIGYQNVFQTYTNTILDRITPSLTQMMMKTSISSSCMLSLAASLSAIRDQKKWAIKMMDASGRPFSGGFFSGTITDFGSYDMCLDINYQNSASKEIEQAQYCMVQYNIHLPPKPPHLTLQTKLFNFTNTPVSGTFFEEISDLLHVCYDRIGRFGICTPSSCSKDDLQIIISNLLGSGHLQAKVTHCEVKQPITFNSLQTLFISIIIVLVTIAIIGSIINSILYHTDHKLITFYMKNSDKFKDHLIQIFLAFSLQSNIKSLFDTQKKPGPMDAINGIRVISMAWIIWTHTYLIPIKETFAFARNYILAVEGFLFQFILNGWVLVDSFFCIGAMVATYSLLNNMEKTGQINPIEIIINRISRFLPSVCFTVALLFLMPALSSGPLWAEYFSYQINKCTNYWWATIFFFNNWLPESKICMLHTWYLSADIQLYIFSIIFLIPLYKYGKKALILLYITIFLAILSVFTMTFINKAPPTVIYNTPTEVISDGEALSIYTPTYIHLGPYFIGIIAGYFASKRSFYAIPTSINLLMWTISISGCLCILFYTYTWNIGNPWTPLSAAFYAAFHRTSWALFVSWVTFACVTGNGGSVNQFLSWKGFIPIGKLSFMMYLMHFPILWMRYAYLRERLPFGHYTMFCEFIINLVISFIVAIFAHLIVEAPLAKLSKRYISGKFPWSSISIKGKEIEMQEKF